MAKGSEVLMMLCPDAEWTIYGDEYESINWFDKEPAITKKQFQDGFAKVDGWKIEQEQQNAAKRQALLDKLGITEDEARLLLS